MTSHLDDRLFPTIDYTRRYQIITDLVDIISCPILQDITEDPIVFNNQFYDKVAFKTFLKGKMKELLGHWASATTILLGYSSKIQELVATSSQHMQKEFFFADNRPVPTTSPCFSSKSKISI